MSKLRRFLGLERKSSINVLLDYLATGQQARTGVTVNATTALEVTAALACIRVLSEGIAQLPLKLMRDGADGRTKSPATDHPHYGLMARRPNGWQTSFEFREFMMFHAVLCGNGYAYKARGAGGVVKELLPLASHRVQVEQRDDWTLSYTVDFPNWQRREIPQRDMLHLRGPSWDSIAGLSFVRMAREALGLAISAERHAALMHNNGARPGGTLSTDLSMSLEQQAETAKAWQAAFSADNAYKTAVLHSGLKWAPMAMTGIDLQSLEQRRFQIEEIARAFRVFPALLGHSDKTSTYASAEQFFLAHVVHSLGPWIERWEEVLSRDLLTEAEQASGLFWKFTVQSLLRGDMKGRAAFYQTLVTLGVMTRNEARMLEDMNPLPGLDEPVMVSSQVGRAPGGADMPGDGEDGNDAET